MDLTDAELADIADDIGVDPATLQSEAVKDCAESVHDERDVTKSQAFAICQDMENRGQLQAPTQVALAAQRDPGQIERVEASDGSVRYTDIMLLAPGVWGDAGSQRHFLYSAENTIPALADNIADTTLNLFHEQENDTTEVGELDESSVYVGEEDGALYGDIVLSMDNAASEFADEALQDAFESRGQKGLKGPSLEIASTEREFNREAGVPEVMDGVIQGVGLVGLGVSPGPGSEDVSIDKQARERAVALSSAEDAAVFTQQNHAMTDTAQLLGALAEELDDDELHELAEEHGIELQTDSEMGMVQDLVEQAASEGFDPSDQSIDELRSFISDNLDPSEDAMAAFDDITDAVLEAEEADSEDVVSAESLLDWIAEQRGGEEEEAEQESDEEDGEMELEDLREQVQANAERIEKLASATEALQSDDVDLQDIAASVQTLSDSVESLAESERVEDLDERLQALEDEPEEPTSLASWGGAEPNGDDTDGIYVDFGSTDANTNREY